MENLENNLISVQRENFILKEEKTSLEEKTEKLILDLEILKSKEFSEVEKNQTLQKTIKRLESSVDSLRNLPPIENPKTLELVKQAEQKVSKAEEEKKLDDEKIFELQNVLNNQNSIIELSKQKQGELQIISEGLQKELQRESSEEEIESKREDRQLKTVRKVFTHSYSLFFIQIVAMATSSGFAYLEISKLGKSNAISIPLSFLFGVSLSIISLNRVNVLIIIYFILYELTNGLLFFEAPFNLELQTFFKILQATFIPIFTLVIISVINKKTKK